MKTRTLNLSVVLVAALFLFLLSSGCLIRGKNKKDDPVSRPDTSSVKPDAPASAPAKDKALEERLSKAASANNAAVVVTAKLPASNLKIALEGEHKIVESNLSPASPTDKAAALERINKALTDDIAAYEILVAQSVEDAKATKKALDELNTLIAKEREVNSENLRKLVTEYNTRFDELVRRETAAKEEKRKAEEELAKVRDSVEKRVQFWLSLGLRILAVIFAAIAGSRVYGAFTSGADLGSAAKSSLWLGICSASAFGLSWATAQRWFYPACVSVLVLSTAVLGYYMFRERVRASALNKVSDAIDKGAVLDEQGNVVASNIDLVAVSKKMNTVEKAEIKKARMERAKKVAIAARKKQKAMDQVKD